MKQGLDFQELLAQVERETASRHDFYTPAASLSLRSDATGSILTSPAGEFAMLEAAHRHMAEYTGIGALFYERLHRELPDLLDTNVNTLLERAGEKPRLNRALDDNARAIVSPRFGILDNDSLLRTILPLAEEMGAQVESCDLSEERMVVKLVSPKLTGEVKVNDPVQVGIMVRNSEVGAGAVELDWFTKRLVCSNGLALAGPHSRGARRRHVGRFWGDGSGYGEVPENEDRAACEKAIWDQVREGVREATSAEAFQGLLERLRATTKMRSALPPEELVQRVGSEFKLSDDVQDQVLGHLLRDEDFSLWGVTNAVTRVAADAPSFTRATDLESLGGQLAHMTPPQWERLVSVN